MNILKLESANLEDDMFTCYLGSDNFHIQDFHRLNIKSAQVLTIPDCRLCYAAYFEFAAQDWLCFMTRYIQPHEKVACSTYVHHTNLFCPLRPKRLIWMLCCCFSMISNSCNCFFYIFLLTFIDFYDFSLILNDLNKLCYVLLQIFIDSMIVF